MVTVQSLSETVSNTLVDSSQEESLSTFDCRQDSAISATATEEPISIPSPTLTPKPPFSRKLLPTKTIQPASQNADYEQEICPRPPSIDSNPAFNIAENFDSLAQQIPSVWSFEYQMGPGPYADCLAGSEDSSVALGRAWTESNSPFSDHIHVLQSLMKNKLDPTVLLSVSTIDQ